MRILPSLMRATGRALQHYSTLVSLDDMNDLQFLDVSYSNSPLITSDSFISKVLTPLEQSYEQRPVAAPSFEDLSENISSDYGVNTETQDATVPEDYIHEDIYSKCAVSRSASVEMQEESSPTCEPCTVTPQSPSTRDQDVLSTDDERDTLSDWSYEMTEESISSCTSVDDSLRVLDTSLTLAIADEIADEKITEECRFKEGAKMTHLQEQTSMEPCNPLSADPAPCTTNDEGGVASVNQLDFTASQDDQTSALPIFPSVPTFNTEDHDPFLIDRVIDRIRREQLPETPFGPTYLPSIRGPSTYSRPGIPIGYYWNPDGDLGHQWVPVYPRQMYGPYALVPPMFIDVYGVIQFTQPPPGVDLAFVQRTPVFIPPYWQSVDEVMFSHQREGAQHFRLGDHIPSITVTEPTKGHEPSDPVPEQDEQDGSRLAVYDFHGLPKNSPIVYVEEMDEYVVKFNGEWEQAQWIETEEVRADGSIRCRLGWSMTLPPHLGGRRVWFRSA